MKYIFFFSLWLANKCGLILDLSAGHKKNPDK